MIIALFSHRYLYDLIFIVLQFPGVGGAISCMVILDKAFLIVLLRAWTYLFFPELLMLT
jgi:hypothetical protein